MEINEFNKSIGEIQEVYNVAYTNNKCIQSIQEWEARELSELGISIMPIRIIKQGEKEKFIHVQLSPEVIMLALSLQEEVNCEIIEEQIKKTQKIIEIFNTQKE